MSHKLITSKRVIFVAYILAFTAFIDTMALYAVTTQTEAITVPMAAYLTTYLAMFNAGTLILAYLVYKCTRHINPPTLSTGLTSTTLESTTLASQS